MCDLGEREGGRARGGRNTRVRSLIKIFRELWHWNCVNMTPAPEPNLSNHGQVGQHMYISSPIQSCYNPVHSKYQTGHVNRLGGVHPQLDQHGINIFGGSALYQA
jgi:hypothetical protein